eukprot:1091980-Rhodomonas_salina.1
MASVNSHCMQCPGLTASDSLSLSCRAAVPCSQDALKTRRFRPSLLPPAVHSQATIRTPSSPRNLGQRVGLEQIKGRCESCAQGAYPGLGLIPPVKTSFGVTARACVCCVVSSPADSEPGVTSAEQVDEGREKGNT